VQSERISLLDIEGILNGPRLRSQISFDLTNIKKRSHTLLCHMTGWIIIFEEPPVEVVETGLAVFSSEFSSMS
jgi:hypothetical protein